MLAANMRARGSHMLAANMRTQGAPNVGRQHAGNGCQSRRGRGQRCFATVSSCDLTASSSRIIIPTVTAALVALGLCRTASTLLATARNLVAAARSVLAAARYNAATSLQIAAARRLIPSR